jgi:hypothetical protein
MVLSARAELLAMRQKGFASLHAYQQTYAANRSVELTAAKVSLSFSLLISFRAVGEALWTIKQTKQGLVLDKRTASFTQLVGAGALLGLFMAVQVYQYHLGTKEIKSGYQVDLCRCR